MAETAVLTLTEFLLARIAEDEAAASGHEGTAYHRWPFRPYDDRVGGTVGPKYVPIAADWHNNGYVDVAEHISRHDPVRVLAECEAKRRIVEDYERYDRSGAPEVEGAKRGLHMAIRNLATVYADHPDYREEWRP